MFATPALIILGEPYLRDAWAHALEGRLTASALVVIGVGAAYAYSVFATIEQSDQVYFDTATMVLMLFTIGGYIEAAARAKAARDLEPLLAAESECATVVEDGIETRRAARDIAAGMKVLVRPGERIPVDGVVVEGSSQTDEALITGESRQIAKRAGSAVIAGSMNLDGPLLIESSGAGSATRWAQICRSVREAHGLGVVHRDLKPGNILLTDRGDEQDTVKVLDFGLVKELDREDDSGVTAADHVVGTPLYIAPEGVISAANVSPRSDVYAVGAIAYALVTGQQVFTGKSGDS
jgi:hypothetical protein